MLAARGVRINGLVAARRLLCRPQNTSCMLDPWAPRGGQAGAMLKVTKGCSVRISYELKFSNGEVLESSQKSGPLDYTHGETKLIPQFQQRIEGMAVGEEKQGVIPAKEIFGDESTWPTQTMPRGSFPKDAKLEVGQVFTAKRPDGQPIDFKIAALTADDVTVHIVPDLKGKDLEFSVKVLVIDDPHAKKREGVAPPPPPAAALKVDVEDDPEK
jgi:FKBP-type peptidyl-prolyl cis-trans isomerase 2